MSKDRIKDDQQFAHASRENHFWSLAGMSQSLREGAMLDHHLANVLHPRRAMRAREGDHAAERVIATGEFCRGRL